MIRTLLTATCLLILSGCAVKKTGDKGFTDLFNGKNLDGWEGDPVYWSVREGVLTGEVTPATLLKQNTFLIWKNGSPANFELIVEYRISASGNSGVNYRSVRVPDLPFALKGYQADIDGKNKYNLGYPRYSGQNYEERGRTFLALRGQKTVIEKGQKPKMTDSLGTPDVLLKSIHYDDWNELRIVAKGNNLKHYLNGTLMSEVIDNDTDNRKMDGLIGVQVHVGPAMKIEYRKFRIRKL